MGVRRSHTTVDSPVGPLLLLAAGGTLCGLYLQQRRHPPDESLLGPEDPEPFDAVREQLDEYFAGTRLVFELPLAPAGTPFQQIVWTALLDIPFGTTVSYRDLAEQIGRPTAARAVGLANGKNPISIIVPCHRVVGSSGDLTGYGGGLSSKRYLLDFERSVAGGDPADVDGQLRLV